MTPRNPVDLSVNISNAYIGNDCYRTSYPPLWDLHNCAYRPRINDKIWTICYNRNVQVLGNAPICRNIMWFKNPLPERALNMVRSNPPTVNKGATGCLAMHYQNKGLSRYSYGWQDMKKRAADCNLAEGPIFPTRSNLELPHAWRSVRPQDLKPERTWPSARVHRLAATHQHE